MSAAEHKWCEPERYPDALDETWTCPECGREHVAYDPRETRYGTHATGLGWRSVPSGATV